MPRYDYECGRCGRPEELTCSMADMPATVPCPCGERAVRVIRRLPDVCIRGASYEFRMDKNVRSNAQCFGRTDEQEHQVYVRKHEELRKMKRERKTSRKSDFECLGMMPGAMADSISKHEGDPTLVQRDPVTFLKKTGLYLGDD